MIDQLHREALAFCQSCDQPIISRCDSWIHANQRPASPTDRHRAQPRPWTVIPLSTT